MKRILIATFFTLCLGISVSQAQSTYNWQGDYNVMLGVVISSMGITTNGSANQVLSVVAIVSSVTYNGKLDWLLKIDKNGYDVFISSFNTFNTAKLDNFKLYPGETLSPCGRLTDSVYGKTLAGTTNLTTAYLILNGKK